MSENFQYDTLFRPATSADAPAIASIHTQNWQIHYRGALPDHYLEVQAPAERAEFWQKRLTEKTDATQTIVACAAEKVIGFCCLETTVHPEGYYLDNLHVLPALTGKGIGKALMQQSAASLLEKQPDNRIYLWVLIGNTGAIGFYDHLGARHGRQDTVSLAGNPTEALLLCWPLSEMANW